MKFKFYLRKSSFKKDKESAQILLNEIILPSVDFNLNGTAFLPKSHIGV